MWEERFARPRDPRDLNYDHWLEPWLTRFEPLRFAPVLDLGCGRGMDSRYLTQRGYDVVAADVASGALCSVRSMVPEIPCVRLDLRDGLPFADSALGAIVASLSLHYYRWDHTVRLLEDVRRCLCPGGWLLARVNSVRDLNYGAQGWPEVEEGCYLVDGELKHFFDRPSLERLFDPWQLWHLRETTTAIYGRPKVVWEIAARADRRR